ncbi:SMI1/KNR4 family protein [Corallococcus llansteffanensis]|uniref:SMI1/KNR4 family protein n=1 Tax=Corallococcus llansteffanensis TaxID=2316731 RepID=A0A3A8QAS1_9BACT|nr:SMI1/KNR4 family protein [Corallococcus llansteffanensis]RKH65268.1 SMI1/KNR4 family protein [Corallococcus llansteffanensis]
MAIQTLLAEISRSHFPNPPATPAQLEDFEHRVGWRLDADLRAFYLHCDGAALFKTPNTPFHLCSLAEVVRARTVLGMADTDEWGPASWFILCNLYDTNFVLIDVSHQESDRYILRDGYREGFPSPEACPRIAGSFSEFLEGALQSNGRWFWLDKLQQ